MWCVRCRELHFLIHLQLVFPRLDWLVLVFLCGSGKKFRIESHNISCRRLWTFSTCNSVGQVGRGRRHLEEAAVVGHGAPIGLNVDLQHLCGVHGGDSGSVCGRNEAPRPCTELRVYADLLPGTAFGRDCGGRCPTTGEEGEIKESQSVGTSSTP